MDISTLTIAEARRALAAKEYSALELTNAYLENSAVRDPEIHAYLEIWAESARAEAQEADERIARGESLPMTGIPPWRADSGTEMDRDRNRCFADNLSAEVRTNGPVLLPDKFQSACRFPAPTVGTGVLSGTSE